MLRVRSFRWPMACCPPASFRARPVAAPRPSRPAARSLRRPMPATTLRARTNFPSDARVSSLKSVLDLDVGRVLQVDALAVRLERRVANFNGVFSGREFELRHGR